MYRPESVFPSGLTWRTWLRAGMALARVQAHQGRAALKVWNYRHRQRRQLSQLPDHVLKDIGISRIDALREADKPFWRS